MLHQTQTVKWSKSPNLFEGHVIDYSYVEAGCIWSMSKISAVGFLVKTCRCSLVASQGDCELWVMTSGFGCFLEPQQWRNDKLRCVINFPVPGLQWILNGSQNSPYDSQSWDSCLSWHSLITDWWRSPGRISREVKHSPNPGGHAQHHHGNTHNVNTKSSFNLEQEKA